MPIMPCKKGGKPGFKYGESGACYTYQPNNNKSRDAARAKAGKQGRAIEASKHS